MAVKFDLTMLVQLVNFRSQGLYIWQCTQELEKEVIPKFILGDAPASLKIIDATYV